MSLSDSPSFRRRLRIKTHRVGQQGLLRMPIGRLVASKLAYLRADADHLDE